MKIEKNVSLMKYTTFRMGGASRKMYFPENEKELMELITQKNIDYFLGGGSNLIINNRIFDEVVNLSFFNQEILCLGQGLFLVGASVKLQKLIITINQLGYGGIEYLYSVPGLVGGAVVMNAGRGKADKKAISDYIVAVKVLDNNKIKWITKEECQFGYRDSMFKHYKYVVLEVKFKFPLVQLDDAVRLRKERIEFCKENQDNTAPNCGTIFCDANNKIMKIFQMLPIGKCGKIQYSSKTPNWLLNNGGEYNDVRKLLKRVEFFHKLFKKKCQMEVILWE